MTRPNTMDTWSWHAGKAHPLGPALRACLTAATAAPSIHNSQPWRFRLTGQGIELLADPRRRLDVVDARGRELLISVGAALLNLRVAVLAHGRVPMTRLFPNAQEPDLVARVALGPPVHPSRTAQLLAHAIPHRHTNRRPFTDVPVPDEVMDDLRAAAEVEGSRLTVADAVMADAVLSLVRIAEKRRHADPDYWCELSQWTSWQPQRLDGVPPAAYGPWSALETVPLRDFGLVGSPRRRKTETFEASPHLAILYTSDDTRRDWVTAGQSLERVLLTATVRGLSTTLMTQPLESPELRDLLADTACGRMPQAIIRLGYGSPAAASPRRGLDEVVEGLTPSTPAAQ